MKEIWLLRHAKAEHGFNIADFDRSLEESGKNDAMAIAYYLKNAQLYPDLILSSPANRAIETARIVYKILNQPDLVIEQNLQIYNAMLEQLQSVLASCEESIERLLLVGHNPGLEGLLVYLVGFEALPQSQEWLGTATFVRLCTESTWSRLHKECCQLMTITSPHSLQTNLQKINFGI